MVWTRATSNHGVWTLSTISPCSVCCVRRQRVPLRILTITHLEDLYANLRRSGSRHGGPLAPETVLNVHQIQRAALSGAERAGLVDETPSG